MFDGEDALGQIATMSLDNQRNLALALARTPLFLDVAAEVSAEMNRWSLDALGRAIVDDWAQQLDHTVPLFRARGLHLDDRHVRWADGTGFSASIVDILEPHGPEQAGDAEDVVRVVVGEEDLGEGKADPVPHHLPLVALAAVEEDRLPLALHGKPGDVAVHGRRGGAGAEEGGGQHGGNVSA